ncbi:MAG: prepilin-type N-terminal cleavage/methylation domain-containing protein [Patescibacteria group bacterium]
MRKLKGFTLIELLVVVAIIGILATVVVVNLSTSQNKARDAKLQNDLEQVANAAEIYRIDNAKLPVEFASTAIDAGSVLTATMTNSLRVDNVRLITVLPTHPVTGKSIELITDSTTAPTKYIVYGESVVTAGSFLSYYTGKIYEKVTAEPIVAK